MFSYNLTYRCVAVDFAILLSSRSESTFLWRGGRGTSGHLDLDETAFKKCGGKMFILIKYTDEAGFTVHGSRDVQGVYEVFLFEK